MKLNSRRRPLREQPVEYHETRTGNIPLPDQRPARWAPARPLSDLAEAPIRTVIINEGFGLLDEISRFVLVQAGIDLAGMSIQGDEALEAVEIMIPQVVVVDLRMPGMTGLKTTERLRRKFPTVGIIVTSSAEGANIESLCRDFGADELIPKKRLLSDLLSAMRRAVAQRAS